MRGVVPETFPRTGSTAGSGEDELLKTRHSRRGETDYSRPTGRITACRSEDERGIWRAGSTTRRKPAGGGARGKGPRQKTAWCRSNRLMSYRGVHYRCTTNLAVRWKRRAGAERRVTVMMSTGWWK